MGLPDYLSRHPVNPNERQAWWCYYDEEEEDQVEEVKQIEEQPITLRVDVIEGEDIRRDGVAQEWMQWLEKVQLREFQHEDPEWSDIIRVLKKAEGWKDLPVTRGMKGKHIMIDDVLFRVINPQGEIRVCLPQRLRHEVVKVCHDSRWAGHLGVVATHHAVAQRAW